MKSKSDEQLKFKSQMPIFVHTQTAWLEAFIDAVRGQFCRAHRSKGSRAQVSFNWGPFFRRRIFQYFYLPWILKNLGTKITIGNNFTQNQRLSLKNENTKNPSGFGGVGLSSRKRFLP